VVSNTPGVVYKNLLIMGHRVSEIAPALPGDVRAYDLRTGRLVWTFHTIPHPGEYGADPDICPKLCKLSRSPADLPSRVIVGAGPA